MRITLGIYAAVATAALLAARPADADILRWDVTVIVPGTRGINLIPGIDLSNRDLQFALFPGNLANINFTNSILDNAHFNTASPSALLAGVNFTNASILGTNFDNTNFSATQLQSAQSFTSKNLANTNLGRLNLASVSFANFNLTNTSFSRTVLTSANFTDATINGANFTRVAAVPSLTTSQVYNTASYKNHDLHNVNFSGQDFSGFNFAGQNLTNASFASAPVNATDGTNSANFTDAIITGASFSLNSDVDFTPTNPQRLSSAQLYSTASYKNHNLQGVKFSLDGTGWNLADQVLTNATISGNFSNASFVNANLTNARFFATTLTGANFTNANITGADLDAGITSAQFYSTASYVQKNIAGIKFEIVDLSNWDFSGQDLSGALFNNTQLLNANFSNANITGATFLLSFINPFTPAQLYSTASYINGNLTGIRINSGNGGPTTWNFDGKNLTNADLSNVNGTSNTYNNAIIIGATFSPISMTLAKLTTTASYKSKDLSGVSLQFLNLTGANLSGQNLTGANLSRTNLTGADLTDAVITGANLSNTTGLTSAAFYSTANYANGNLAGVRLALLSMQGWNFAGKNLANAILNTADLTGAQLSSGNLSGADLTFANLTNVPLTSANLTGANLNSAQFAGASFNGANVANANLAGAKLAFADLAGIQNLTSAQLYLADPRLSGTKFTNLNLSNFDLSQRRLDGADFTGTTLTNANFRNSDLRGATGWNPTGAITSNTIRPDGTLPSVHVLAGEQLSIFNNALPVHLQNSGLFDANSTLYLFLTPDWSSPIIVDPGTTLALGGILNFTVGNELTGKTLQLFQWDTIPDPSNRFVIPSSITSNPNVDLSHLYTNGTVTFGTIVPEPASLTLAMIPLAGLMLRRRRHRA